MDRLIYERNDKAVEPQRIVFEVSSDLSIKAFKLNCVRLASALGYSSTNIKNEFGSDTDTGDPAQLKLLLD